MTAVMQLCPTIWVLSMHNTQVLLTAVQDQLIHRTHNLTAACKQS